MTRKHQKTEEVLFAGRAGALLGESWTVEIPNDEERWPDLLVKTATGCFGLEVRKLHGDELSKGSLKRKAESSRSGILRKAADLYYKSDSLPVRVLFYGQPDDPETIANRLSTVVPSMKTWDQEKVSFGSQRWLYVVRLPDECAEYRWWTIVSDSVGWVGIIDSSMVQRAICEKAANLVRYRKHVEDVRLLLVCDRTRNSGKFFFGDTTTLDEAGFNHIYLLSFPDNLRQIPA